MSYTILRPRVTSLDNLTITCFKKHYLSFRLDPKKQPPSILGMLLQREWMILLNLIERWQMFYALLIPLGFV